MKADPAYIRWDHTPELNHPYCVVGYHGWSNAGSVATDTIDHLWEQLRPEVFAGLNHEPFLNFTLDRPIVSVQSGLLQSPAPIEADIACWKNPNGDHDLVLIGAREPHFNWMLYGRVLVDLLSRAGVVRVYTLGGVQDTISHAIAPIISVVASRTPVLVETLATNTSLRAADYEGPGSIHSYVVHAASIQGMDAISLWGHVPPYLQNNPRVVARMVDVLNDAVGMECPTEDLNRKSIELDRKVDEILGRDPNLKQFVESIEEHEDSITSEKAHDNIIRLNDFIRRDSHREP